MADTHRLMAPRKILIKDLNEYLTCSLCGGYFIDATTVVDCSHTFCRACVVRHFESSRLCPSCGILVHKSKPLSKLRSDTTLQTLIYKVVPSLYSKELQRRADFYHSTGFRANSSCSDDSILGDGSVDNEEWILSNVGDPTLYFSPDDSISLSVEYYQNEFVVKTESPETNPQKQQNIPALLTMKSDESSDQKIVKTEPQENGVEKIFDLGHKRYLQCPAAVKMTHLMKFLRMKFALSNEHRVDIIYEGEVLPPYLSLMDIAYTFKWKREHPMRFFYLIYVSSKRAVLPPPSQQQQEDGLVEVPTIPPLKIEITNNLKNEPKNLDDDKTSSIDKKQHKDNENNNNSKLSTKSTKKSTNVEQKSHQKTVKFTENYKNKTYEYKVKNDDSLKDSTDESFLYDDADKDEIKAFAERRDREWALQKYADSEIHVSKKRKKNKHSKSEFMHKKRKLHAEITSNEISSKPDDSLKLKVKLSLANGHKHKHRSNNSSNHNLNTTNVEQTKSQELSPKERLLQMRQVRHKHINPSTNDEKVATTNNKTPDSSNNSSLKVVITPEKSEKSETPEKEKSAKVTPDILNSGKTLRSDFSFKTSMSKDICKLVRVNIEKYSDNKINALKKSPSSISPPKLPENNTKTEIIPIENKKPQNSTPKPIINNNKLPQKPPLIKLLNNNPPKLLENNKVLLQNPSKPTQEINNKKEEINKKTEPTKQVNNINNNNNNKLKTPSPPPLKTTENQTKVQQTIDESKTIENKLNNIDFKNQSGTLITKNFTVSKVETGTKRKLEPPEGTNDKRPSLEITVINLVTRSPQTSTVQTNSVQTKPITNTQTTKSPITLKTQEGGQPPAKKIRPPPLTIPLGRIQKMNNLKANSQIQKPPEKCDIFGALDLSAKPGTNSLKPDIKSNDFRSTAASPKPKIQEHIQNLIRPKTPIKTLNSDVKNDGSKLGLEPKTRPNISNLQMLSESAVQIREMMVKSTPITSIPNLIKKLPNPITQNAALKSAELLQKTLNFQTKATPNLIPKPNTNNTQIKTFNSFTAKPPQILSKNLQKLPKLNEINKSQFCRLNANNQIRSPRPTSQNQTIRNIPNPSLLVRQQNQNRINSLTTTNSNPQSDQQSNDSSKQQQNTIKQIIETTETVEKRSTEKTSEPPPLKPIESFKK